MKRWIKRTLIGIACAGVLVGVTAAACHHHGLGHGWNSSAYRDARAQAYLVSRVAHELKLDAAQIQRLTALANKLGGLRTALDGTAANPRAEMAAIVAGPVFDRDRADSAVAAGADALRSASPELIASTAEFFDSLMPEQKQRVRNFVAQGQPMHGD